MFYPSTAKVTPLMKLGSGLVRKEKRLGDLERLAVTPGPRSANQPNILSARDVARKGLIL
jgi:hypothetical protein